MKSSNTRKKAMTARTKPAADNLFSIAASLGDRANRAVAAATWRDRVRHIHSVYGDKSEGILRSGQVMRDAGEDLEFATLSICLGVESLADERINTDPEINKISEAIRKKEAAYGLKENEYWPANEAPDDVEKLRAAWHRRFIEIEAEVFREFGEDKMAADLMADEDAFNAKYREPARLAHFGPFRPVRER